MSPHKFRTTNDLQQYIENAIGQLERFRLVPIRKENFDVEFFDFARSEVVNGFVELFTVTAATIAVYEAKSSEVWCFLLGQNCGQCVQSWEVGCICCSHHYHLNNMKQRRVSTCSWKNDMGWVRNWRLNVHLKMLLKVVKILTPT